MKKSKEMSVNKEIVDMTDEQIISEIDVCNTRTIALYRILASRITKKTSGKGSLSSENANVAEYWLQVAKDHPHLIAAVCDVDDFAMKIPFFKSVNLVASQDEQSAKILQSPRNTLSWDLTWYISYVRKQVIVQQDDPVYKLIMQKEPNARQSLTKSPLPTPPQV